MQIEYSPEIDKSENFEKFYSSKNELFDLIICRPDDIIGKQIEQKNQI